MTALSTERLAEIRERHSAGLGLERPGDVAALLAHVDHLTAENARLRDGIEEALIEAPFTSGDQDYDFRGSVIAREMAALLNPPTECSHDWGDAYAMPELGWLHVRECADCGALERLQ